jgi:hypothetical protein
LDRKNVGGEFSFEYQITSTIKEVFQQDTVSLPMTVIPTSINNDAVLLLKINPSFDFGTALLKNTNKLACHSRLTVWELTTETQNIGG